MFPDFLEKKTTNFSAVKTRISADENSAFSKGVSPWFWSKIDHFNIFLFEAKQAQKMSFTIFQKEKTPFQTIKTRCSTSRQISTFPKLSYCMVFVKTCEFSHLFTLGKIRQENEFHDILQRKDAFLPYKNKMFKKSKN